jgi:hypothetical protein
MAAVRSKFSLGRRALLAAAVASLALGAAPSAFADGALVDLKIVDRETGKVLRTWRHHGRLFVAGEPGDRYALRVTNHTGGRVLVVLSVDGVNILTGETAGYGQRGYVFAPYQSFDLAGWRKSDEEIAAFVFAAQSQSYAARTGRPADVGVIGLAAFREKDVVPEEDVAAPRREGRAYGGVIQPRRAEPMPPPPAPPPPPPPPPPDARAAAPEARSTVQDVIVSGSRAAQVAAATSASPMVQPTEKLGTAHGAREVSVTHSVPFERATAEPQTVLQIEYDSYPNLVLAGVIPGDRPRHPRPFPEKPKANGYVPDPPQNP